MKIASKFAQLSHVWVEMQVVARRFRGVALHVDDEAGHE